jgi:hypothetical protein
VWIVLRDTQANKKAGLPAESQRRVAAIAQKFMAQMGLV